MSEPKYKVGDTVLVSWPSVGKRIETIASVSLSRYSSFIMYESSDGSSFHEAQVDGWTAHQTPADQPTEFTRETVLTTAEQLINGDRAKDYGDASENFQRIANLWAPILGVEVTATDVALCLTQLKVARLITSPAHKDSWVDAAGYIGLGGEIAKEQSNGRK
ncbi:DUF6378 domain-containing protein [Glutamicibacter sp. AOP5-A2-18]|uniref:DUF6378 domain-containing protein n=1 Tax=Glutamicibacter sp. AOP5-A2-18 TaxID=3457656 RepID=UPI00403317C3